MPGFAAMLIGLGIGLLLGVLVTALVLRPRARGWQPDADPGGAVTDSGRGAQLAITQLQEAVLERAPVAVLTVDASDAVLLANRRSRELPLLDKRGLVQPLLEIARKSRAQSELTQEIVLPSAGFPRRVVHVRVRAIPLQQRAVALVVEDVTEAHRVDNVRRDFVANVSHEIKTPVGALGLLAEAASESLSELPDAQEARHFVDRIAHESARLGRLVSELLDLSRLQGAEAPPALVPVRLDDVVAEAADRTSLPADAKNITIVRGGPTGAVVLGVETQLVTAVANLLDNAINYSPEGTRVGVAVRRQHEVWEVTVTDQGVGIPASDLDRIFERFYRVDPARSRATGGTGLGLAIVKHVVRNHGGEVRVWSSPGAGSTFTLRLPVAHQNGDRESPHDTDADADPSDAAHVSADGRPAASFRAVR